MARLSEGASWRECQFMQQILDADLPLPEHDFKFHPTRKWRLDFAWPARKVAVEIEGLLAGKGGRHQRFTGFSDDCDKYNAAIMMGWRLLRFTQRHLDDMTGICTVKNALTLKGGSDDL